ncbi:hypothetical protein ILUMI_17325, partial [Ignelater luminosus]
FPENKEQRNKWIKACKLNNSDNVSTLFICSRHFLRSDYIESVNVKWHHLKPTAVPTQMISGISEASTSVNEIQSTKKIISSSLTTTGEIIRAAQTGITETCTGSSLKTEASESQTNDIVNFKSKPADEIIANAMSNTEVCNKEENINENAYSCSANSNSANIPMESYSTLKKRRFYEPHYVNEVTTPDVKTSRRARRLEEDLENYFEYKMVGVKKRLKAHVIPHIFSNTFKRTVIDTKPKQSTVPKRSQLESNLNQSFTSAACEAINIKEEFTDTSLVCEEINIKEELIDTSAVCEVIDIKQETTP